MTWETDRGTEIWDSFYKLLDETERSGADLLLIAGDLFHRQPLKRELKELNYRFSQLTHAKVVIVAGNHDSAARLEAPLPLLQEMRTDIKGIVRRRDGEIDYDDLIVELKNRSGEVEALCLAVPFLRQGDYPVVVTDGNPYAEGVKELYTRLQNRAMERRKKDQAIVAVGHLQATGSEIAERDFSERTIIGGLECVSPDTFTEQIAYTALGHIHKSQRVSGRENIRYAGSPLPMSFAERDYHHGVVMVTLAEGWAVEIEKREYTPLVRLLSVPKGKAVSPEEVLDELARLPLQMEEAKGNSHYPYLEVKVLVTEPEPMLRQQIEEILSDKAVRLARIVSVYRQAKTDVKEEEALVATGLQEMNPLQILKMTFENTYQTEMPEELERLFEEAVREGGKEN